MNMALCIETTLSLPAQFHPISNQGSSLNSIVSRIVCCLSLEASRPPRNVMIRVQTLLPVIAVIAVILSRHHTDDPHLVCTFP